MSIVAPSPDWFTGIYNFYAINIDAGAWYGSFDIFSYPWDAGTEMGDTYSIGNESEDPHLPIFQLTADTVPGSGILLDPTGTDVLPVARWYCSLQNDGVGIVNPPTTCEAYASMCVVKSDCCSGNCRRGICRRSDIGASRSGLRIGSNGENGTPPGGAAGRNRGGNIRQRDRRG